MVYSNNFGQTRVGVRNGVVTQVVNAVDADATAFIAAAGITNLTQAAAISTLVDDLKTYGLWTKIKALYPFVGGSAASHKFNLKDPRDLDAAYRLVFNGGWVHSSTGALPNGTTGYANTFLNGSTRLTLNNTHLSYYSRTNSSGASGKIEIGSQISQGTSFFMGISEYGSMFNSAMYHSSNNFMNISNTRSDGFLISTRISSTNWNAYKNGTLFYNQPNTNTGNLPNDNIYIGCNGYASSRYEYSDRESGFASIGDGLTDTEATNFYNSVQKFQTTLGRQIGSPIVSDTDAQAFINAAGLTDLGQANAVNTLVVDLKAAGVWTKMKAVYPFVGGTATTHKWNLKDPRDLDAAYRLVFNGGWTHTSTGALPNGTTGYANTKLIPSSALGDNSAHLSYYSRTSSTSDANNYVIGADNLNGFSAIILRNNVKYFRFTNTSTAYEDAGYTGVLSTNGFFVGTQDASNVKLFRNNTNIAQNTGTDARTRISIEMYIGCSNSNLSPQTYTTAESAFASIGDGLSDTEASAFYTAVQKYQTTLGRQIGTPVLASGQTAGLLDTYSGAAAAYSLRKLRNGYYGNAIRVRRSSDNAEQDIAFKTDGTLDTTSLLAFVGNGNGFVTTWYDQSGNDVNISQSTAANQPQIVSTGSITTKNSKPTIKFDGINDYMTMLNSQSTFSFLHKIGQSFVSFVGYGVSSSEYVLLESNWGSTAYIGYSLWTTANNNITNFITKGISGSPVSSNTSTSNTIVPNTLFMVNTEADPGNATASLRSKLYFNNSSVITNNVYTNTASTSNATYNLNLGAAVGVSPYSFLNGGVSELIIYNSDQSTNRTGISTNINSYYSIY